MNPIARNRWRQISRGLSLTALVLAVTACTSTPPRQTRAPLAQPPQPPLDINAIPDAVPRPEPIAKRGNPPFYDVFGKRYYTLRTSNGHVERGIASWYGPNFHGKQTSTGEPYDMYAMTAAHKTLPLPTYARVTNLNNNRSIVVRINDRGPFVDDRIIDLSYTAAAKLDMLGPGTAPVEITAIDPNRQSAPAPVMAKASPGAERATFLQVGAFRDRSAAVQTHSRIKDVAESAHITEPSGKNNDVWYRVRIGPLAGAAALDRISAKLSALGYRPFAIVAE